MAQWGKNDASSNAVLWAPSSVKLTPNTDNRDALYGNTTVDSFVTGQKVGMFGVDATEAGVTSGGVISYTVTFAGSGYGANAAVTLSGGGGSGATANSTVGATGRISSVNANQVGTSYESSPSVTVAAPSAVTFNALSAVSNTNDTIAITTANSIFLAGDKLTYTVATGNTVVGGLTSGAQYYVVAANTTTIQLSETKGGAAIDLTASVSETGHSLTGETATARATVGGGKNKGAHAGWVLRREGTGGRAGRVHYETLVAMGSITGDGSDDSQLPDS